MKKFNVGACIVSIVAAVLYAVAAFMVFSKKVETPTGLQAVLLLATALVFVVFLFALKNKVAMLVPALAFIVLGKTQLDLYATAFSTTNTEYKLVSLVLLALFIVALVFATTKNAKWAAVSVLVVAVLVVVKFIQPMLYTLPEFQDALHELAEAKKVAGTVLTPYEENVASYGSFFLGFAGSVCLGAGIVVYAIGLVANAFKKEEAAPAETE